MRILLTIFSILISSLANAFQLTSTAFQNNQMIPIQYTCHDDDISPPLAWFEPPVGTRSYALIMNDPDAPKGNWVHWVLYNISQTTSSLPENFQPLYTHVRVGSNSWNKQSYGGPCPPSNIHRYIFTLYALDQSLDLKAGLTDEQLLAVISEHILGSAKLIGKYGE